MYDEAKGRYEVRLSGPGAKTLSLKPNNFILPENTRVMVCKTITVYLSLSLSVWWSALRACERVFACLHPAYVAYIRVRGFVSHAAPHSTDERPS
jgi:hypothetical protein